MRDKGEIVGGEHREYYGGHVGIADDIGGVYGSGFWDVDKQRWRRAPPHGVYGPWWWGRFAGWTPTVLVRHKPRSEDPVAKQDPTYEVVVVTGWYGVGGFDTDIQNVSSGPEVRGAIVELLVKNYPRTIGAKKALKIARLFPASSVPSYRKVALASPYRNPTRLKRRLMAN